MMNGIKKILFLSYLVGLCISIGYANSSEVKKAISSLENFRRIIILENGRKKPLDTYAQNILKQFSGKSKFKREPAIIWFSRVLFTPNQSFNDRIFLVNHPEVLNSLGIEIADDRDRYSFTQLGKIFPRLSKLAFSASKLKDDERTVVENEIIILFNKLYLYQQLSGSLQFAIPHEDFTFTNNEIKKAFNLPESKNVFCFLDLVKRISILEQLKNEILLKDIDQRSEVEKEIINTMNKIQQRMDSIQPLPLTIIHDPENHSENWISPGESLYRSYRLHKPINREIYLLGDMVSAFINGHQNRFDHSLESFNEFILDQLKSKTTDKKISAEILYNQIDPFHKSEFFYGFSLFFILLSLLVLRKWLYGISFFLLLLGVLFHSYGMISRMMIMSRPPVTNLYETFIFTGWMTVILGIILEFFKKKNIGILTGSTSGIIMLLIAGKYALEGDTMGMLVAVLDSNFWLSTHVITITIGFAGIVISGIIGHVFVFQTLFIPENRIVLKNTFQSIYATQAFGLIFTFLGTVMGGMWADQSWGRFWGWDPKENGALVVVLWSVILFHARLSKWIKEVGFALGSIVGIITIALAWFGINLLGVGLHSYGFTSGIALVLIVFIIIEFIFVLASGVYLTRL